jgi:hypothetical protein
MKKGAPNNITQSNLIDTVASHDLERTQAVLSRGESPNQYDAHGRTPLILAIEPECRPIRKRNSRCRFESIQKMSRDDEAKAWAQFIDDRLKR